MGTRINLKQAKIWLMKKSLVNMRGIYRIVCTANNRVYIGQSINLLSRLNAHKSALMNNRHENEQLQEAYNKFGSECFMFEVIENCAELTDEQLTEREQYWIDYYGGKNSEDIFNFRDAGSHGAVNYEVRKKISKPRNWVPDEDFRRRVSESLIGRPSPMRGRKQTEKFFETMKRVDRNKVWTEERRKHASEVAKGRPKSEEHKKHLSDSQRGKKLSEETKIKMSEARKGRKVSDATREKLRQAALRQWRRVKNGCNNKS